MMFRLQATPAAETIANPAITQKIRSEGFARLAPSWATGTRLGRTVRAIIQRMNPAVMISRTAPTRVSMYRDGLSDVSATPEVLGTGGRRPLYRAGAFDPSGEWGQAFGAGAGTGATTLPAFQLSMMISVARADSAPPGSQRSSRPSLPEAIASEYSRQVG